jgi:hypothetical protein
MKSLLSGLSALILLFSIKNDCAADFANARYKIACQPSQVKTKNEFDIGSTEENGFKLEATMILKVLSPRSLK